MNLDVGQVKPGKIQEKIHSFKTDADKQLVMFMIHGKDQNINKSLQTVVFNPYR